MVLSYRKSSFSGVILLTLLFNEMTAKNIRQKNTCGWTFLPVKTTLVHSSFANKGSDPTFIKKQTPEKLNYPKLTKFNPFKPVLVSTLSERLGYSQQHLIIYDFPSSSQTNVVNKWSKIKINITSETTNIVITHLQYKCSCLLFFKPWNTLDHHIGKHWKKNVCKWIKTTTDGCHRRWDEQCFNPSSVLQ